jgi:hypothetical protein
LNISNDKENGKVVMDMVLKTYVEYLLPGLFMPESESKEIESRSVELALKMMPKSCYCFYFYSVETVEQGGETLRGKAKNHSGRFYPGAQRVHWKAIPDIPNNDTLRSNLRGSGLNGYGIKTRMGNWQPAQKGDKIIPMTGA